METRVMVTESSFNRKLGLFQLDRANVFEYGDFVCYPGVKRDEKLTALNEQIVCSIIRSFLEENKCSYCHPVDDDLPNMCVWVDERKQVATATVHSELTLYTVAILKS